MAERKVIRESLAWAEVHVLVGLRGERAASLLAMSLLERFLKYRYRESKKDVTMKFIQGDFLQDCGEGSSSNEYERLKGS